MDEKKFNKAFNIFILAGMAVAVIIATALKAGAAQTGRMLLFVSAFGSLMGVMCSVCSANGIVLTFLFGIFDVTIYAVVCFISGKYGNALLHALYFLPMQFIGWHQWNKRGTDTNDKVKARRLSSKQGALYAVVFLLGSVVAYFILAHFDRSAADSFIHVAVLMDALSMMCNIIGQYLLSAAYMEQWFFWIGVNVFSVIMWSVSLKNDGGGYAVIYLIKYSFYLLNSLNGLRIWMKLSKGQ